MCLAKLPNERKLTLCRKYYMAGFAFLPFMWAINAIWFLNEAFWAPPYPEQKQIRRYVIVSGVGALLWLVGLISWVVVFQQNRSVWGATADYMSFIIPKGVP
ncbi:gamma-secretase subunit pen-2-like [Homarus americanus]|uniref:Gamma-secretase subunit PEN-2 n=1 Tax=Homarus americanus TaxID=6706 RepID=A0A8J5N9L6_HOMAM|nr:gamma-secretase subunit pen-2-like [Homarus americanus]KAG7176556.1 Gamma-secretase subunit pen-2-like [Homarus americanus]